MKEAKRPLASSLSRVQTGRVLAQKKGHHLITITQDCCAAFLDCTEILVTSWPPCSTQQLLLAQAIRNQSRTTLGLLGHILWTQKGTTAPSQPLSLCLFYYKNNFPTFYFYISLLNKVKISVNLTTHWLLYYSQGFLPQLYHSHYTK